MPPLGLGLTHGGRGLVAYGLAALGLWLALGLSWPELLRAAGAAWCLVLAWGFWRD